MSTDPTPTQMTVAETPAPPIVTLRMRLLARAGELKAALPSDVTPEVFIRAVVTAATLNPDILACTWNSVWESCIKACRDGLLPDGRDAALVPYKGKAGYIAMYPGLLNRCYKTGLFRSITAEVVRQGDEFQYWVDDTGKHVHHVPSAPFSAPVTHAYALAVFKQDGHDIAVLTFDEVLKIRNVSRAAREDAPWVVWFGEMAKKTALRRVCKYLPNSRNLPGAEEDDEGGELQAPTVASSPALAPPAQPPREPAKTPTAALDEFAGAAEEAPHDQAS